MRIVRSRCKKPATPIINRDLIAIFNFVRNFLPHFQLATVKTLSTKTAWRINDTMMGRYHLGSSTVNTEKEAIKSLHCHLVDFYSYSPKSVICRIFDAIIRTIKEESRTNFDKRFVLSRANKIILLAYCNPTSFVLLSSK